MPDNALPPQPLLAQTGSLVAGFSQSALRGTLDGSAQTYSQLALKVVQYIQGVLADAANSYQAIAARVATPIVAGLNQAQGTIDQIGGQVRNQVQAGLNAATAACGTGCAAEQGARPGQYAYSVWQDLDTPSAVALGYKSPAPPGPGLNWCFRAGWDDYYDAVNYKEKIQGSTPPSGCRLPGGLAAPPGGGPGPIQSGAGGYALWCNSGNTPAFVITAWPNPTLAAPPPPPSPGAYGQYNGLYPSEEAALTDARSSTACGGGQIGTPPDWYGGCVGGQPATWEGTGSQPAGATSVAGPFASQALALEAATAVCVAPPPPPPPATGQCQCITQAKGDCLMLDLCDWKKFEDALYNALCRWYEQCLCKLKTTEAMLQDDCDNLTEPWATWWDEAGTQIGQAGSVGSIIATAGGIIGTTSAPTLPKIP